MASIGSTLAEQFERSFQMLGENILALTDDQWVAGGRLAPVRWATHLVQSIDFYSKARPEDTDWHSMVDWEGDIALLPTRTDLIAYLWQMRDRVEETLSSMTDEWFLEPTAFPWTGRSRLAKYLYLLRHTLVHTGEVAMVLRTHGADETAWH